MEDRRNISHTINVNNNQVNDSNCMQFMLTRSGVNDALLAILRNEKSLNDYDLYDQYLIIDYAVGQNVDIDKIGEISSTSMLLTAIMYYAAPEDSDVDHPDTADAEEIPFTKPLQCKRGPGISGPRTMSSFFTNGYYERDQDGNIDFNNIYQCDNFIMSPVFPNSLVNLEEGAKIKEYGVLLNGNMVHIPSASRSQHFSIANRVAKNHRQTAGNGGNSPDGLTWHHLIDKYKMVLVDRTVHQKFGHNGGYYFW